MAEKKKFILRIDQTLFNAVARMADDHFRSINAQVEQLIWEGLKKENRLPQTVALAEQVEPVESASDQSSTE